MDEATSRVQGNNKISTRKIIKNASSNIIIAQQKRRHPKELGNSLVVNSLEARLWEETTSLSDYWQVLKAQPRKKGIREENSKLPDREICELKKATVAWLKYKRHERIEENH